MVAKRCDIFEVNCPCMGTELQAEVNTVRVHNQLRDAQEKSEKCTSVTWVHIVAMEIFILSHTR